MHNCPEIKTSDDFFNRSNKKFPLHFHVHKSKDDFVTERLSKI